MTWTGIFEAGTQRIRADATNLAGKAALLASFRFHRPDWAHYSIRAAARDLRNAADDLDKLADKIPLTEKDETHAVQAS